MAARRYDQIISLIQEVRPQTIVEVGVHKGLRSAMMCREALKFREKVTYFGFDVFETEDEAFHKAALNGKGMPSEVEAGRRLESLGQGLTWVFIKGDTRQTLHNKTDYFADIVFIDGDHRAEVIRGDYLPFKSAKCVVLDDWYSGGHVDTTKYGCNTLVTEAQSFGKEVQILPVKDQTNVGDLTSLAVIWNR